MKKQTKIKILLTLVNLLKTSLQKFLYNRLMININKMILNKMKIMIKMKIRMKIKILRMKQINKIKIISSKINKIKMETKMKDKMKFQIFWILQKIIQIRIKKNNNKKNECYYIMII